MRKILIVAVVLLVVLGIAAVLIVPRLARVERYRGRIEAAIHDNTGLEATLGEMRFKLLPRPALRISPVTLSDPATGTRLESTDLAIRAELGPLLHGKLVVRRVGILHPALSLARTRDGLALPALPLRAVSPVGSPGSAGGLSVEIGAIELRDGTLSIPGRKGAPPWQLIGIDADVSPTAGTIRGSATLASGGSLHWQGRLGEKIRLDLERVKTEALAPLLPAGLLHSGGTLGGTVTFSSGGTVSGSLEGRRIALLGGPRPLAGLDASFSVRKLEGGLRLEKLKLAGGNVEMTGSGLLSPALNLTLKIPNAAVARAVDAARAVFPFPLQIAGPGALSADLKLTAPAGREVAVSASGKISAGKVSFGADLPSLATAGGHFRLTPGGVFELRPFTAVLAGGKLAGRVSLKPAAPRGKLHLRGTVAGADVAALLADFPAASGTKISGRMDADADLAVDLSREALDLHALGGWILLTGHGLRVPGLSFMDDLRSAAGGKSLLKGLAGLATRSLAGGARKTASSGTEEIREARARVHLAAIPWKLTGIRIVTGDLTASGAGTLDPVARTVALKMRARLGVEASLDLVKRLPLLRNLEDASGRVVVPLNIAGPLASPKVEFNLQGALAGRSAAAGKKKGPRTELIEGLVNQFLKKKK